MKMIDYYLVLLITFLGLAAGFFLSMLAGEEVKTYRKYLVSLRAFCLLSAACILFSNNKVLVPAVLIACIALYKYESLAYSITSVMLGVAYSNGSFPLVASILLILGFSHASLQCQNLKKSIKTRMLARIIKYNAAYLIIGLLFGVIL